MTLSENVASLISANSLVILEAVGIGLLFFEFVNDPPLFEVHVFTADTFQGEVTESEEMRPKWYHKDEIPFDQMWKDDVLWFPHMFQNQLFKGYFTFEGHETIVDYTLDVVDTLD